jgi:hypothetical protein
VLNVPPEGAKNVYRNRTIPLEREDVHWAIRQLRDRAHRLGATEPMHCLFPFAQSKLYDPTRSIRALVALAQGGKRMASGFHITKHSLSYRALIVRSLYRRSRNVCFALVHVRRT